ncbi:MAG: lysophospholipid acyltransferase family protein [Planctomycetes bacterium]|nr:lysophospholipid acyltransferase family protein [Planctomycetota bacterium]
MKQPVPLAPHDPPPPGPLLAGPAPLPPASQRKRTPLRRAGYAVAAPLIHGVVRALWATARVRVVVGAEHLDAALAAHPACVPTLWHEELVAGCAFLVDAFRRRGRPLAFLVSPSVDGDLVEKVVLRAGGVVVRGSATRNGVKSLRDLYRLMRKQGASPFFTPDGPTGPAREAKAGALMLAQLAGMPLLPLSVRPRRAWRLRTWDRLLVPLPFTRVTVAFGPPRDVPADLAGDALELGATAELTSELEGLRALATR